MGELKDVGITRNSDLVEAGIDEFAHLEKESEEKKVKKSKKKAE